MYDALVALSAFVKSKRSFGYYPWFPKDWANRNEDTLKSAFDSLKELVSLISEHPEATFGQVQLAMNILCYYTVDLYNVDNVKKMANRYDKSLNFWLKCKT